MTCKPTGPMADNALKGSLAFLCFDHNGQSCPIWTWA